MHRHRDRRARAHTHTHTHTHTHPDTLTRGVERAGGVSCRKRTVTGYMKSHAAMHPIKGGRWGITEPLKFDQIFQRMTYSKHLRDNNFPTRTTCGYLVELNRQR